MSNLNELKLNGSNIVNLSDLGTNLNNLSILWVSRCNINDIGALSTLNKLSEL